MSFFSKFFVFLIGLAVLAVVCAWIMGGESQKNSTRISIDASPNSVFRYLVDDEKITNWSNDLVSAGPYKNDEGSEPVTVERIVSENGNESVWQDSIMRYKLGESLSIQSRKGGLTKTTVFQLEENDLGGTNVLYRTIKSASGLEQLTFSFHEKTSKAQLDSEMKNLKKLIESEVEPGSDDDSEFAAEDSAPVVVDSSTDNNESSEMPVPDNASASSDGPSVIDRVLGTVYSDGSGEKPKDGERNFESLFGTGG